VTKTLIGARIAAVYELQASWMEPRLSALGISWATFQLLTTVANAGDRASQIEVATRMGVTAATLSEAVQAHVGRGLLEQTPSARDKRVRVLRLTPKSRELVAQIKELVVESDRVMTRGILPSELAGTATVLDRVLQNLESALDAPTV
jgi:MarR family transcriptional regulator for hemolysin